jgi:hypothetical protein
VIDDSLDHFVDIFRNIVQPSKRRRVEIDDADRSNAVFQLGLYGLD